MKRPLFPDAEHPARINPWEVLGIALVGTVVAVVIAWLFLHPVFE